MKWFFALNDLSASFGEYAVMIKAAVTSAARNAPALEPHFIYDGNDKSLISWMQTHGVPVIRHRVSIYSQLEGLVKETGGSHFLSIGSGAFLRVDLPIIIQQNGWNDEYVLYTDADVVFLKQPDFSQYPCRYFAVASELTQGDNININTGVMLMNIPNLARHHQEFLAYTASQLKQFCDLDWDQTAYRTYYHLEWQNLSPLMNWKPYWEMNHEACIIHFHGLKPTCEEQARAGTLTGRLKEIFDLAGEKYFDYTTIWREYATAAEQPFQFPVNQQDISPKNAERYRPQIDALLDQKRTRTIKASDYAEIIPLQPIPDPSWRVIKGLLILWLFSKPGSSDAYLETSHFFALIEDFEAALVHAHIAYQYAPESVDVILWLAAILRFQGNLAGAKRVLELGSALNAKSSQRDIRIPVQLGYICMELMEIQAALGQFRNALSIDPTNQEALRGIENAMRFLSTPSNS